MNKNLLTTLIIFILCSYIYANDNDPKADDSDIFEEIVDIDIIEDDSPKPKIKNNKVLADSIQKLLIADPYFKNSFDGLNEQGLNVIESEDKKIRIISWENTDSGSKGHYCNLIQYYIAPGKTRFAFFGIDYFLYNHSNRITKGFKHNINPSKIHLLNNGRYIIEGVAKDNGDNVYKLIGIDTNRGLLRNGYFFSEEGKPSDSYSVTISPDCTERFQSIIINDIHLKIPQTDETGCLTSEYFNYYFNGTYFSDAEEYERIQPKMTTSIGYILRLYYKNSLNMKVITSTSPTAGISLVADAAHNKDIILNDKYTIKLRNTDNDEHVSGKKIHCELILWPINNTVFIENFKFYHLPLDSAATYGRNDLTDVTYTAGREEAFSYEQLRYTAVTFNCQPSDEEYKLIRWAIEIDNKLQLLDETEYIGAQIDLQMKEEWLNKEVSVIPYIKGGEINRDIAVKTFIVPDKEKGSERW